MSDTPSRDSIIFKILAVTGIFLTLSLLLFLAGAGNWPVFALLTLPGAFLYKSFLIMAFFVPIYLGILCVVLQQPEFRQRLLLPLNLAFVPMLTFSVVLRIAFDEEPNGVSSLFVDSFGKGGALLFLTFLGLFETVIVTVFGIFLSQNGDRGPSFSQNFQKFWVNLAKHPFKREHQEQLLLENAPTWKRTEFIAVKSELRTDPFFDREIKSAYEIQPKSTNPLSPEENVFIKPVEPLSPVVNSVLTSVPSEPSSLLEKAETIRQQNPIVNWDDLKTDDIECDADDDLEASQVFDEEDEELEAFESELDERLKKELTYQSMVERIFQSPEETVVYPSSSTNETIEGTEDSIANTDNESEEDEWKALDRRMREGQLSARVNPLEGGNFEASTKYVIDASRGTEEDSLPRPFVSGGRRASFANYSVPVEGLLTKYKEGNFSEIDEDTRRSAHVLKMTLKEFNIEADVTGIRKGPVVTMFEILPAAGVKLSKIAGLSDNIALGLAATSVRIVAPIPGKHAVGIEVPNRDRRIIGFAEMVSSPEFVGTKADIPIVLGKDISGEAQIIDLAKTPHLLIAGATGSGKSVCVNSLITSILYSRSPEDVRLLMVDPKIVELKFFNNIPHLLAPVITEPKKALQAVQWCLYEMERRYALLDAIGAKDIKSYNAKIAKRNLATNKLPYIVFVVDEFADLMATSGKDLEGTLARLAAMSRAVGIHLVLATQRPSIDVITGLIKANFPSRIAFMVASKTDSRIILDSMGAEKLLGKGDMLFTSSWNPFPSRIQGAFLSEDDVERVVDHVRSLGEPDYIEDEIFFDDEDEDEKGSFDSNEMDPLFEKAVEIVRSQKKASASFLQRRLGVGYNRAARMVECMEEMGIVGPQNGSKPRDIIHSV